MSNFYEFHQNNSGGDFVQDENLDAYVIVEATSAEDANERAWHLGVYFDGCHIGVDCPCCGDRWYPVDENDASAEPSIYGEPILLSLKGFRTDCVVHYLDGKRVRVSREVR